MSKPILSVEDKLSKARILAVRDYPFWGMLLMNCILVEDESANTMWADGRRIGYNPKFVAELPIEELVWAFLHETGHNAFGHVERAGGRHRTIHNYATDYFLNNRLYEEIDARANGSLKEVDFERITGQKGAKVLRDMDRFGDKSSDEIYAILVKELLDPNYSPFKDNVGGPGDSEGEGDPNADPLNQLDGLGGDLNFDAAKEQGYDKTEQAAENTEFWKGQIATAATAARRMGKMPAGMDRYVDMALTPTVPWQETLQHYVQPMPADFDFLRPDRRFTEEEFIFPDFTGQHLNVWIVADTSGSVSGPELNQYLSDTCFIIRSFERVDGYFVGCDSAIHDFHPIGPEDPVPNKIGGGGGTSFIPVFNLVQEMNVTPHALVYFTDGEGMFPNTEPDYPVIWIIVNSAVVPPWGTVIYVQTQ